MKQLFAIATAMLLTATLSAQTTGQTGSTTPATPAPKTDAPAKSIAGKWNVSVDVQGNAMLSVLDIKIDGKKVTGTLTSDQGSTPVEGEFADTKLTLNFSYNTQNGPVPVTFTATLKDDAFTGTADAGQVGSFPFHAERVKDK